MSIYFSNQFAIEKLPKTLHGNYKVFRHQDFKVRGFKVSIYELRSLVVKRETQDQKRIEGGSRRRRFQFVISGFLGIKILEF
jgi:hypothetical protein